MNNRRNDCRVCGSFELVPILTLPNYPLVAGPVTQTPKTAPTCDLEVRFCMHCGICSLLNTDTDNLTYGDDYTSSNIAYGYAKSMDKLTDRFAAFVGRAGKTQGSIALEIGCYDGTFMSLLEKRYGFSMIGCEPCVAVADEARRKGCDVYPGTFNATNYSKLDIIIARNILEHIPSPVGFVAGIASTLKQNGAFVLEVPAGERSIRNGILGTVVPEHPCYYGKRSLGKLLGRHFLSTNIAGDRATIRATACFPDHGDDDKETALSASRLIAGKRIRQARYDVVREDVGDERVDIFGANTCTLELIAAGAVRVEQIDKVYDDDPRKWGKYLVNTSLVVLPRSAISEGKQRRMLVCSYTHRQSITEYITKQNNIAVKLYGDDE